MSDRPSKSTYEQIRDSFRHARPSPRSLQRVPEREWPAWANWIGGRRAPGDRGIGDTVERELGDAGKAFKRLFEATFGELGLSCGCENRQQSWNALYPYGEER